MLTITLKGYVPKLGYDPRSSGWKPDELPLFYKGIGWKFGFEPKPTYSQYVMLPLHYNHHIVGLNRIELLVFSLWASRVTNYAIGQCLDGVIRTPEHLLPRQVRIAICGTSRNKKTPSWSEEVTTTHRNSFRLTSVNWFYMLNCNHDAKIIKKFVISKSFIIFVQNFTDAETQLEYYDYSGW